MAGRIDIDVNGVRKENACLPEVMERAHRIRSAVVRVKRQVPSEVAEKYGIRERLDTVCMEMAKLEAQILELYEATNSCARQYEMAERENYSNAVRFD